MDLKTTKDLCGYKIPSGEPCFIAPDTLLQDFKIKGCHGTCLLYNEKIYLPGYDLHHCLNIYMPVYDQTEFISTEQIQQRIQQWVYDPEIDVNVWDLGLIYDIHVHGRSILIKMTLTSPTCGMGPFIMHDVQAASCFIDMNTCVELVFDPPWSMDKLSRKAKIILGI